MVCGESGEVIIKGFLEEMVLKLNSEGGVESPQVKKCRRNAFLTGEPA